MIFGKVATKNISIPRWSFAWVAYLGLSTALYVINGLEVLRLVSVDCCE